MTTRPQLASSPATAVFTSGELAIESAMRLAAASFSAPSTVTSTILRAPSPSRTTWSARSRSRSLSATRKASRRASAASEIAGCPSAAAAPVAKSISVSEVDVSLSTVTELKVGPTPAESRACSAAGAMSASVTTKESIVAMSGAIMPAPLAIPLVVTLTPPISAMRVATFG
ncbi:hypothetical protein D9M70_549540 [compost metagenome]